MSLTTKCTKCTAFVIERRSAIAGVFSPRGMTRRQLQKLSAITYHIAMRRQWRLVAAIALEAEDTVAGPWLCAVQERCHKRIVGRVTFERVVIKLSEGNPQRVTIAGYGISCID